MTPLTSRCRPAYLVIIAAVLVMADRPPEERHEPAAEVPTKHENGFLTDLKEPEDLEGCSENLHVYRAVYEPALYAPRIVVTLRETEAHWSVQLRWLAPKPGDPEHTPTIPKQITGRIPADAVRIFLAAMKEARPFDLENSDAIGLDGTLFLGDVCGRTQSPHAFSAWSPDEHHARHRLYFNAVAEAAIASFEEDEALSRLELAIGRLWATSLWIADRGGTPRVFRLSGGCQPGDLAELEKRLNALPADEPVILYMGVMANIDDVASLLPPHPTVLQRFGVHEPTVIVGSRRYWQRFRGSDHNAEVVATLEEARTLLAKHK
jgi:hypothetical protein